MMNLEGKVALITGASSGIGKATALKMARAGVKVGVLGRDEEETQEVVKAIQDDNGAAVALVADVSQPEEMQAAIEKLVAEWGRLDIVFANAGINGVWAPLEDLTPEEWDETLTVNLKGTFLTVKYAVPHLKERGGSVIVTSSVNGTRIFSNTGATAYSCSKAAQVAFTKMVALELARYKIRVNAICPGSIETNIGQNTERRNIDSVKYRVEFLDSKIPLTDGEPGSAEQVADLVMFLASDAASHISGTEMWIDGAQSLLIG
jgi:NAD(P)-dependent dehydrogenase (short-subunit alcohol dehydrogenase family)